MLLLQEDVLLFLLWCKYLFTPSNFTSAACLFATSEGKLYRSYIGFSERIFQVASTGKTRKALLRPIYGREAVARMSLASKRIWPENAQVELREVNGQPALIVRVDGRAWSCFSIEVEQGQIQAIRIIINPDKLTRL